MNKYYVVIHTLIQADKYYNQYSYFRIAPCEKYSHIELLIFYFKYRSSIESPSPSVNEITLITEITFDGFMINSRHNFCATIDTTMINKIIPKE